MTYSKDFMKWVSNTTESFSLDFSSFGRRIDGKRKGFIVVDTHTGKVAYSWCNPADNWNDDIGIAIAYARLRGIKIPSLESYKIRKCIGKYIKFKNVTYYVTPTTIPFGGELDYFCVALPKKGRPYIAQIGENCEVELVK